MKKKMMAEKVVSETVKWEKMWGAYVKALADLDAPASGARGRLKYARLAKAEKAIRLYDRDFYRQVIERKNTW